MWAAYPAPFYLRNPRRWVLLCYPLYRKGNGGTERASYWPRVTQLLADEAPGSEVWAYNFSCTYLHLKGKYYTTIHLTEILFYSGHFYLQRGAYQEHTFDRNIAGAPKITVGWVWALTMAWEQILPPQDMPFWHTDKLVIFKKLQTQGKLWKQNLPFCKCVFISLPERGGRMTLNP